MHNPPPLPRTAPSGHAEVKALWLICFADIRYMHNSVKAQTCEAAEQEPCSAWWLKAPHVARVSVACM